LRIIFFYTIVLICFLNLFINVENIYGQPIYKEKTDNKTKDINILTVTNLPIVKINTYGHQIPNEDKITAHIGIIYNGPGNTNHINDPFNHYEGYIGISTRGQSSLSFPKKSYSFETRDSAGNSINVGLLGMPAEDDWTLIANYSDKTLMRNNLTYDLAREMGYWAARSRYCEVIINNNYVGVYTLTERIKRDKDRVPVSSISPSDNSGDELTGGYIIKIDKKNKPSDESWFSPYPPAVSPANQSIEFQYHYPKPWHISQAQKTYIQAYVDSFETVLKGPQFNHPDYGYHRFADMYSFIDYFIIQELSKNIDAYRLSAYFYKNKNSNGGKLTMGPVWDFDLAYRNADYCDAYEPHGWAYQFGNICPYDTWQVPFWWEKLLSDTYFANTLKCRWEALRTSTLDTNQIFAYIDSVHSYINQAQGRNFTQWPILGHYVWPNPHPIPSTYLGEINALKKWFRNRLVWLDNNMPGQCMMQAQQIFINEFMAINHSTLSDTYGNYSDWIELYNPNSHTVDIGGWHITDDLSNPRKYRLPISSALQIPAHGFMLLWADGAPNLGVHHLSFNLSGSGEAIGIYEPINNHVVDSLTFSQQTTDISFGRYPDGTDNWYYFNYPTPNQSNTLTQINYLTDNKHFKIYPNPAKGPIKIEFFDNDLSFYTIYDVSGKLIERSPLKKNKGEIYLKLAQGTYFFEAVGKSGVFREKIIVIP